ncbi:MAG: Txe/YoeB family addiction module toxin [Stenotrophomonas sp.]|uniref:Txe/YoeB family addiction module toxin n=1 Tax=Stenotrophomonas sp. TaxID=69392 RepID=UPI003D6D2000
MILQFSDEAWEDYLQWQKIDRRKTERINCLIKAIMRTPFEGIGKPELLRFDRTGWWSRRIDLEHRMVYRVAGGIVQIAALRHHY